MNIERRVRASLLNGGRRGMGWGVAEKQGRTYRGARRGGRSQGYRESSKKRRTTIPYAQLYGTRHEQLGKDITERYGAANFHPARKREHISDDERGKGVGEEGIVKKGKRLPTRERGNGEKRERKLDRRGQRRKMNHRRVVRRLMHGQDSYYRESQGAIVNNNSRV